MANRFQTPREQFFVSPVTGEPLSGGKLYFYASGTTTPLNTYSDSGLTIANSNPVVLNSDGEPATDIFLQNLAYTVTLTDANDVVMWTADNVYTSDFSTIAMFATYPGDPNGNVAGTAGSPTTNASVIWDRTNNILYVCTATGTATTAIWTAINSSTTQSSVPPPQGYLSLVSLTPIPTTDTTSDIIYYMPFSGNSIPVWTGASYATAQFSQMTLTLTAADNVADTLYDVFVFYNAGVLTIGTGPAWAASGNGVGDRGTGGGTTQLAQQNGLWTNAVLMSLKNNGTTYAGIAANQATYVGTIHIDTTPGLVTCHVNYGSLRKWGVWNCYNRHPLVLKAGSPTSSWNVPAGIRIQANQAGNSLRTMVGLAEEEIVYTLVQDGQLNLNQGSGVFDANLTGGIGYNATNAYTGKSSTQAVRFGSMPAGMTMASTQTFMSKYVAPPKLGVNYAAACENANISSAQFFGTESNMTLSAQWMG